MTLSDVRRDQGHSIRPDFDDLLSGSDLDDFFPHIGRVIRPVAEQSDFGAVRTLDGHRNVRLLYDDLRLSRILAEGSGERALGHSGTIEYPRYRFRTPAYYPGVYENDELLIREEQVWTAYNIIAVGTYVEGAMTFIARRKAAQNADMDVYV